MLEDMLNTEKKKKTSKKVWNKVFHDHPCFGRWDCLINKYNSVRKGTPSLEGMNCRERVECCLAYQKKVLRNVCPNCGDSVFSRECFEDHEELICRKCNKVREFRHEEMKDNGKA